MSISECLKDYESKHGKSSKKKPQVQDESVLRKNENIKNYSFIMVTQTKKKVKGKNRIG